MPAQSRLRWPLDIAMTLLFVICVADRFTENTAHEYTGAALLFLVMAHLWLNRRWFSTLFHPKWQIARCTQLAVNVFLLVAVTGMFLCAIGISQSLFAWLGFRGGLAVRKMHLGFAFWSIVLAGVHLGLHWRMISGAIPRYLRAPRVAAPCKLLCALFALYGIYAFLLRKIPMYLALDTAYLFWPEDDSLPRLLVDYAAIIALFALAGHFLGKYATGRRALQTLGKASLTF